MMLRRLTSLEIILLTGVGLITCAVIPLPMSEFSGIITEIDPQPPAHAIYPLIQRKRRDTGEHKEAASAGFAALLSVTGEFMAEMEHTNAQHGDPCTPSDNLSNDFCENAIYPQKGRMFCSTKDSGGNGTCECKYAKKADKSDNTWEQLTYDKRLNLCLSPERGRCYDLLLEFTDDNTHKYYARLQESDIQCDNTGINKKSKAFLLCTKPHPRRFVTFDKRGFYCLRKEDRSEEEEIRVHESHHGHE